MTEQETKFKLNKIGNLSFRMPFWHLHHLLPWQRDNIATNKWCYAFLLIQVYQAVKAYNFVRNCSIIPKIELDQDISKINLVSNFFTSVSASSARKRTETANYHNFFLSNRQNSATKMARSNLYSNLTYILLRQIWKTNSISICAISANKMNENCK